MVDWQTTSRDADSVADVVEMSLAEKSTLHAEIFPERSFGSAFADRALRNNDVPLPLPHYSRTNRETGKTTVFPGHFDTVVEWYQCHNSQ